MIVVSGPRWARVRHRCIPSCYPRESLGCRRRNFGVGLANPFSHAKIISSLPRIRFLAAKYVDDDDPFATFDSPPHLSVLVVK